VTSHLERLRGQRLRKNGIHLAACAAEASMSDWSPANTRDQVAEKRPETNKQSDNEHEADERNADEQNQKKGHGPLKGTDTPATTNAEDLDKAKRTTL
jgi:hypothetical protein